MSLQANHYLGQRRVKNPEEPGECCFPPAAALNDGFVVETYDDVLLEYE
jgi:hypothetical protein